MAGCSGGQLLVLVLRRPEEKPFSGRLRAPGGACLAWDACSVNHVSKAQALAWFQAFRPAEVSRVAGYKKPDLIREAGQHVSSAKWLPDMLRTST